MTLNRIWLCHSLRAGIWLWDGRSLEDNMGRFSRSISDSPPSMQFYKSPSFRWKRVPMLRRRKETHIWSPGVTSGDGGLRSVWILTLYPVFNPLFQGEKSTVWTRMATLLCTWLPDTATSFWLTPSSPAERTQPSRWLQNDCHAWKYCQRDSAARSIGPFIHIQADLSRYAKGKFNLNEMKWLLMTDVRKNQINFSATSLRGLF